MPDGGSRKFGAYDQEPCRFLVACFASVFLMSVLSDGLVTSVTNVCGTGLSCEFHEGMPTVSGMAPPLCSTTVFKGWAWSFSCGLEWLSLM